MENSNRPVLDTHKNSEKEIDQTINIESIIRSRQKILIGFFVLSLSLVFVLAQELVLNLERDLTEYRVTLWVREIKPRVEELLFVENSYAIRGLVEELVKKNLRDRIDSLQIYDHEGRPLVGIRDREVSASVNTELLQPEMRPQSWVVEKKPFSGQVKFSGPLDFAERRLGYISIHANSPHRSLRLLSFYTLVICLALLGLYLLLQRSLMQKIRSDVTLPLKKLSEAFKQTDIEALNLSSSNELRTSSSMEIKDLFMQFRGLLERLQNLQKVRENEIKYVVAGQIAAQVSHDIRSPLSALNMVVQNLSEGELSGEKRILIVNVSKRIQDIANSLLAKTRVDSSSADKDFLVAGAPPIGGSSAVTAPFYGQLARDSQIGRQALHAYELMLESLAEKQQEAQGKQIKKNLEAIFGAFVMINPVEFYRVMSNLLNNALEAIDGEGLVEIQTRLYSKEISVTIIDNGCGISSEVLKKLGSAPLTHGKENGNGLGFLHAKQTIERWGGRLTVQSRIGMGTMVTLTVPVVTAPSWWVGRLNLQEFKKIILVDDESFERAKWRQKFAEQAPDLVDKIVEFASLASVQEYFLHHKDLQSYAVLMDHNFAKETELGLDVLQKFPELGMRILVSHQARNTDIQARCEVAHIGLVDKEFMVRIPIQGGAQDVHCT